MFYLHFQALGSGQVRGRLFQASLGIQSMELQYRLQLGEMEGVGEHLRVSLRSGELVATGGKIWIFHDPARSAAQRVVFSLEGLLTTGERRKDHKEVPRISLKQSSAACKQDPWYLWLNCSSHTSFGSPVTAKPTASWERLRWEAE